MFTGIIQELAKVISINQRADIFRLVLSVEDIAKDTKLGDSIAVNGVCLTVVGIDNNVLEFDISNHTYNNTSFKVIKRSDMLNVEKALIYGKSAINGHFVTGHIDGVGTIKEINKKRNTIEIKIFIPEQLMQFVVDKGSIAINGISLTIACVNYKNNYIILNIIPHSLKYTTLHLNKIGDIVNIETDCLAKYILKNNKTSHKTDKTKLSTDDLVKCGFI